jgi:hypothetical protein
VSRYNLPGRTVNIISDEKLDAAPNLIETLPPCEHDLTKMFIFVSLFAMSGDDAVHMIASCTDGIRNLNMKRLFARHNYAGFTLNQYLDTARATRATHTIKRDAPSLLTILKK